MSLETKYKQPADVLDFDVEFERWLPDDATITTIEAIVDSADVTIDAVQNMSPTVKVWISGGVDRATYKVTVKVGTDMGHVKETEFRLRIKEL